MPKKFDIFHCILESIWISSLETLQSLSFNLLGANINFTFIYFGCKGYIYMFLAGGSRRSPQFLYCYVHHHPVSWIGRTTGLNISFFNCVENRNSIVNTYIATLYVNVKPVAVYGCMYCDTCLQRSLGSPCDWSSIFSWLRRCWMIWGAFEDIGSSLMRLLEVVDWRMLDKVSSSLFDINKTERKFFAIIWNFEILEVDRLVEWNSVEKKLFFFVFWTV